MIVTDATRNHDSKEPICIYTQSTILVNYDSLTFIINVRLNHRSYLKELFGFTLNNSCKL